MRGNRVRPIWPSACAALLAFAGAGCRGGSDAAVRAAFARCAPGDDLLACAQGLNAAGVICEEDLNSQTHPSAPLAYRCTMESGPWTHVSILAGPQDRKRVAYLSREAAGATAGDLEAAARAMAAACGGPGKPFKLPNASGYTWTAAAAGPASGTATLSFTLDAATLEEAWTVTPDFGPPTAWAQSCERGMVKSAPQ